MKGKICITIFLMSCGVQPSVELSHSNEASIIGKWIVISNRMGRTPQIEDISENGYGSFYTMFGATYWSPSNGKTFNLQENGQVVTDIVDSDLITQIDMRYEIVNDSLLAFSCKFPKDSIRNIMPVKYKIIEEQMTWLIDGLFEVKLKKE